MMRCSSGQLHPAQQPAIQGFFLAAGLSAAAGLWDADVWSGLKSPSVLLSGHTENAGHFLQPTAMAIGHSVMVIS
jgi:hypothetical protein